MPDTRTRDEKTVDLIQATSAIIEKANGLQAEKVASEKAVAGLIPDVVQVLIDNERIDPGEKEAAEEMLKDPAQVLEILARTAVHKNAAEQRALGTPGGKSKKASYDSMNDNYVGRRIRPGESASDKAFREGLGF